MIFTAVFVLILFLHVLCFKIFVPDSIGTVQEKKVDTIFEYVVSLYNYQHRHFTNFNFDGNGRFINIS